LLTAKATSARLRSGGICRRDVAGREPPLGRRENFAKHAQIGALRFDQSLVGEHVHIGRHGIEQYALPCIAQCLAPGQDLELRTPNAVGGLEPIEQHLAYGQTDGPWLQRRALHGIVRQRVAHGLQARAQARHDLRPVSDKRLRYVLVDAALPSAISIELRT
jgi:hypothetical protein